MSKIIIYHDMTDLQATYYVMKVIQGGRSATTTRNIVT